MFTDKQIKDIAYVLALQNVFLNCVKVFSVFKKFKFDEAADIDFEWRRIKYFKR